MLSDDLARAQQNPQPILIVLAASALLGFALGFVLYSGDGEQAKPAPEQVARGTTTASPTPAEDPLGEVALSGALGGAVNAFDAAEGTLKAAVQVDDDDPVVAGEGLDQPMEMWSMSKVPTALALMQVADDELDDKLRGAMERAIVASENCPQRHLIYELQKRAGGVQGALDAVKAVFTQADADNVTLNSMPVPPDEDCAKYFESIDEAEPQGEVLQLGESTWTIDDAVEFAAALGQGEYGEAGEAVLELMRKEKEPSGELGDPSEYTVSPDWGAGRALREFKPEYKGGWGGAHPSSHPYLAGQIAIVHVGDDHVGDDHDVAMAAVYQPHEEPENNDPGPTQAEEAVERAFEEVAKKLKAEQER